jgi:hypothetical protein
MVTVGTLSLELEICPQPDPVRWDSALASLPGAHPLQSWPWGEAKQAVGESVERVMLCRRGIPVLLAQIFQKHVSPLGIKTAWVPRGPILADAKSLIALKLLKRVLRDRGYRLIVAKPYAPNCCGLGWGLPGRREQTFIIDLTRPLATLEKSLHHYWRHNKNRFSRSDS